MTYLKNKESNMNYTLSELAQEDIIAILKYTLEKWGINQAVKYQEIIDEAIFSIVEKPLSPLSKPAKKHKEHTRYLQAGKHHIYYTIETDLIVVNRILHQQQNPELYL